jgi:hypothetical protein
MATRPGDFSAHEEGGDARQDAYYLSVIQFKESQRRLDFLTQQCSAEGFQHTDESEFKYQCALAHLATCLRLMYATDLKIPESCKCEVTRGLDKQLEFIQARTDTAKGAIQQKSVNSACSNVNLQRATLSVGINRSYESDVHDSGYDRSIGGVVFPMYFT